MQVRRKGRKRIIKLIKDQEQLAQDKLHEISCLSEDKFVDQSHMLSIEHVIEEKIQKKVSIDKDIKNIIDKCKHVHSKIKTESSVYSQKCRRWGNKTSSVFIANKLESTQVFVGVKPKNNAENKFSEINILVLDKLKARTLSTFNSSQSKSIPVRKLSTQLSDKLEFCIFGQKKGELRNSMQVSGDKNMDKRKQKLEGLRNRMRTSLFFSHNDKYRTLGQRATKFQ